MERDVRSKMRSFALGGLLGAAGAVAAVRRVSGRKARQVAGGLTAFEDAPCFLELVEEEAQRQREAGEGG